MTDKWLQVEYRTLSPYYQPVPPQAVDVTAKNCQGSTPTPTPSFANGVDEAAGDFMHHLRQYIVYFVAPIVLAVLSALLANLKAYIFNKPFHNSPTLEEANLQARETYDTQKPEYKLVQ